MSITAANRADIRVVEGLVHDLKAIPEHVREKAAEVLGELGDSRAVGRTTASAFCISLASEVITTSAPTFSSALPTL